MNIETLRSEFGVTKHYNFMDHAGVAPISGRAAAAQRGRADSGRARRRGQDLAGQRVSRRVAVVGLCGLRDSYVYPSAEAESESALDGQAGGLA